MPDAGQTTEARYDILVSTVELRHPLLRRLLADWLHAAAAPGSLPGHDFADPQRLDYMQGQIVIFDVVPQADNMPRFRYRFVGAPLVARRGRDVTGSWIDEHTDAVVAKIGPQSCAAAVQSRRPVHVRARREIAGISYPLEYLVLPLVNAETGQLDRLVSGQIYPSDAPSQPAGA
ncbi:hypothetical protein [Ferrovibrio sp.]|uniref:hypothetical protein n=1 Tax=Ferrovibrio sp. TaxID=1917215 RepID=UPI00263048F4|nr:hypothetical protein [Ferrovibrio sp.]